MKKTFIFYTDWIDYTQEMNREEKWLFLETILAYQNWEELPKDINTIKFIWSRVQKQLNEDNIKWSEELIKRKEAWKLWGLASATKSKQVLPSATKSKQVLPSATKSKQVLPSATKSKQLPADNDNDNENENENENDNVNINDNKVKVNNKIISKDIIEQSSISIKKDNRNIDINKMQEFIKEKVENYWFAYNPWQYERGRLQNILTWKEINSFAEKHNMNIYEFTENIINLSVRLDFWRWKINNAETLYKFYAKVYNEAVKIKSERKKPRGC